MTDQSIFNDPSTEATPQTPPANSNPQVPPQDNSLFENHLAAIKNESGEQKYTNVLEALKGTAGSWKENIDCEELSKNIK